nr:TRAP transporter large permease subunit [Vogesella sp.]
GLLMGVGLIITWLWVSRGMQVKPQPRQSWAQRRHALLDGIWALMLPVIIIGGLKFGVFTPTEAAVVAAVYSLLVSLLVYRELKLPALQPVFVHAARTTATVMFLCAAAMVSSYMITLADLPAQIGQMLGPLMEQPRMLMAAMMLLLLLVGIVMDLTPTILVLGPVMMPLVLQAGIDPTYFGVMFILVGSIGLITPPVCTVLNVVCGIARISLESATRGVLPFLGVYLALMALLVAVPELVTVPAKFFR